MKNLLCRLAITCLFVATFVSASAQGHYQPCHGQDTSTRYMISAQHPRSIAISTGQKVAVSDLSDTAYGAPGTVKVWKNLARFMMGLHATDTLFATSPGGVIYDTAGNLYVAQTQRTDSNILIFDTGLNLVRVIDNSPGTPSSWFNPRGLALDAARNLYVVSDDSVDWSGADIAGTGKLIKISNPLTSPTKSVAIANLNGPKAVAIKDNNLYVTEYAGNKISRYNLSSLVKVDSAAINKPMDIFSTGCKLYCTEHDSNSVKVFEAGNLHAGVTLAMKRLDAGVGPFGVALDNDVDLFICDSNKVFYFSDSESVTDTDLLFGSGTGYLNCINRHLTLYDTASTCRWYTHDTTAMALATTHGHDSVLNIFGRIPGTYWVYCAHGSITDSFSVTIGGSDISAYTEIRDSLRGGVWTCSDSSVVALVTTPYDSVIHYFGYRLGSSLIYYTRGSHVDTFSAYVDTTGVATAGSIYTYGNSGDVYGSVTICMGTTIQLLNDTYSGGAYWSISDPTIAGIDEASGTVWPLKPGHVTATFTASGVCGGFASASFGITIDSFYDAGTISGPNAICIGSNITLHNAPGIGYWTNSSPGFASTSSSSATALGLTGVSVGTDIITYHTGHMCSDSPTYKVKVFDYPVGGTYSTSNICNGFTYSIVAPGSSPYSGTWASGGSIFISTSTDSTAIITGSYGSGYLYYTATNVCGSATSTWPYYVGAAFAGSISGSTSLCAGSLDTLSDATSGGVWFVSDTTIGTINASGILTGVSAGTELVWYAVTSGYCTDWAYAYVTVVGPSSSGTISGSTFVCTGTTDTLTSSVSGGTWTGSGSIATIDSMTGILSARTPGTDTIIYMVSGGCVTPVSYVVTIGIAPVVPPISGASIICLGTPAALSDTATGGTWSVATHNAAVTSSGSVSGVGLGMDTVRYSVSNTCGTSVASHPVTIETLAAAGTVTTSATAFCVGASTTLADTASGGSWSTTNSLATVSTSGVLTLTGAGTDTVLYSVSNYCGTATARLVAVIHPIVVPTISIAVHPRDTLCFGDTMSFTSSITNGGTAPQYEWMSFGTVIGSASALHYAPSIGDHVTCTLISNALCASPDTVQSSILPLVVLPTVTPVDSISIATSDSMSYEGQIVSFHSDLSYCTSGATYQWFRDGNPIPGATNMNYSQPMYHDDSFYCVGYCNAPCATRAIDTSSVIVIYASYLTVGTTNIHSASGQLSLYPNPGNGTFEVSATLSESKDNEVMFSIADLSGKLVTAWSATPQSGAIHQRINLRANNDVPSGTYVLRMVSGNTAEYIHFVVE